MTAGLCEAGACCLITITPTVVEVTDSKTPDSPVLTYDYTQWRRLIGPVPAGQHPACVATLGPDSYAWVGHDRDGTVRVLLFAAAEMVAFVRAVRGGAYRLPVAVTA